LRGARRGNDVNFRGARWAGNVAKHGELIRTPTFEGFVWNKTEGHSAKKVVEEKQKEIFLEAKMKSSPG